MSVNGSAAGGIDFEANFNIQWDYSHIFDEGIGVPDITGAEIKDSETQSFNAAARLFNTDTELSLDEYGVVTPDRSGSFNVSEAPFDSYNEIIYKFKEMIITPYMMEELA